MEGSQERETRQRDRKVPLSGTYSQTRSWISSLSVGQGIVGRGSRVCGKEGEVSYLFPLCS